MRTKIAILDNGSEESIAANQRMSKKFSAVAAAEADVIVALGGDGFMLQTLHNCLNRPVPIFGMNMGTVGFLMNEFNENDLVERVVAAQELTLHPLRMRATDASGKIFEAVAINEISLLRQTRQAATLKVLVDDKVRIEELVCDGVLVATPAGSTAYNLSAHGPIIPLGSELLALTPISAFRPRRWRGALLPHTANVRLEIVQADKRPVSAVADTTEIRDVVSVTIHEDRSVSLNLLFDPEHNLAERILMEQFVS
jgi:NAD+ kinase